MAERWELEEGEEIAPGRTIVEHLGGGNRYDVYLVWDDRLYMLAVAKILRRDHLDDEAARRRLKREADLVHRLSHPVIVRGFGGELDGEVPHLLLEHLDGPTLQSLVNEFGALVLEQLIPLVMEVSAALHYLSEEGVVHLDVKPSNIVMGAPPRLIDLSVARSVRRAGGLKRPVGTDAYMAPEQCDPEAWPGRVGPPADVWGLGATLYHAATGHVPFPRASGVGKSDDKRARFPQLVRDPSPPDKRMRGSLADLTLAMLERDPDSRPTAAEVADALEPLVAGPPKKTRFRRRYPRPKFS